MAPLFSYQPFKALMTLFALCATPPTLIFWCLYYIPRGLRPNPNWSVGTSVGNATLKWFYKYATAVRLRPWLIRAPGPAKSHVVEVPPSSKPVYRGVLDQESIRPAQQGAIWFPRPFDANTDANKTVVIHLQGGAFVTYGDAHQIGTFPAATYEKCLDALTFYAQYRQSLDDSSRFPAALQDLVSFYQYLLDQGVSAPNIVVAGDSSGGNLVIAFLRYLEANDGVLPPPKAAVVWSPWVTLDRETLQACDSSPRAISDCLGSSLLQWGADAYHPLPAVAASTPDVDAYISPLHHPFATRTPLWIHAGTAEIFYNDIKTFAEEMEGISTNRVKYAETKDAPHDLLIGAISFSLTKEAEESTREVGEFLKSLN